MATGTLSDFIRDNIEAIMGEWEQFAASCLPASAAMDPEALRDHAEQMLRWIADDLETPQSPDQQSEKSMGRMPNFGLVSNAGLHGHSRFHSSFSPVQVFAEFRALRASVVRLWTRERKTADERQLADLTRFHEAVDQAVSESIESFSKLLTDSRDMFEAILGHDLRNPLGAIMNGSAHLVASLPEGSEERASALTMLKSGERMRLLITDILEFSRSRLGGGFPLAEQSMDMAQVCQEVVDEVLGARPGAQVSLDVSGDVTGTWDPERVKQVVSNLLNNALQHGSRDRGIRLSLVGLPDEVCLDVHNWGSTLSPQEAEALFDVTRQNPKESKLSVYKHGLGLGLHIARLIVEAHGGTIRALSTETEGTRFTTCWPRTKVGAEAVTSESEGRSIRLP